MPTLELLPATLDLVVTQGDEIGFLLDFSIDLTAYNWTAIIYETTRTVNIQYPGGIDTAGDAAAAFTITEVNAAAGQLSLSLQESVTSGLSETQTYRWYLRGVAPGTVTRTYVSGKFSVKAA
jgi:hypothetical protein